MATYVFGRARPILKYQFKSQGFLVTEFWLTPTTKESFSIFHAITLKFMNTQAF